MTRDCPELWGPLGMGTVDRILRNLRFDLGQRKVLLVFDEAQHLSLACLETIRELLDDFRLTHDREAVGRVAIAPAVQPQHASIMRRRFSANWPRRRDQFLIADSAGAVTWPLPDVTSKKPSAISRSSCFEGMAPSVDRIGRGRMRD